MDTNLILQKQDLTYLSWSKIRNSSGTAGSFLKSYSELSGRKIYYKLSDYDVEKGIVGHECVNELIVDRLLNILGIEHLHYQLIYADIMLKDQVQSVYLCASEDFKQPEESKIALDALYELEHVSGETPLAFCMRQGWENYLYQMIVVDFLILNRDRHGANLEVLRNSRKRTLRLTPLFDHGLSFLCRCRTDEEINCYDVMEDKRTNSYIGSRSTKENLQLIPKEKLPQMNSLQSSDRKVLMEGLDSIIPQNLQDKIWDMIWRRWCYYEDFCNSR